MYYILNVEFTDIYLHYNFIFSAYRTWKKWVKIAPRAIFWVAILASKIYLYL